MRAALALLLGAVNAGGSCGGECPPAADLPRPMNEARARELAPGLSTGIALSTTLVRGDCRPKEPEPSAGCAQEPGACLRERRPLRVLLVPLGVSVPLSDDCPTGFALEAVLARATLDRAATELGELAVAAPPGDYRVFLSADGRCAGCGAGRDPCELTVERERITVRDLVLDTASR